MTALSLIAVFALVLLNGFFVAAEFALVRVRTARLESVEESNGHADLVRRQVDEINQYLSACQLGITLASIAIGFLGEPVVAHLIEPLFGVDETWSTVVSIIIAYLLVTAAHITVGEQVPKMMAIAHAEQTAVRLARPLVWFERSFRPAITALSWASSLMLRMLGVRTDQMGEGGGTPEELKLLIAESFQGGQLEMNEATMLSGVFHLHEQEARDVMTPAPAMVTVDLAEDVETALRRCVSSGHTRLVVTEDDDRDRIRGFVHSNVLARQLMAEGPNASLDGLVNEAPIVPETKPLDDLLADLQRRRTSLAIVVDEYGRTAGLVSVEDIVEEVVGEIDDETDPAGAEVRRLPNGDWWVHGHVSIADLVDRGLALPEDSDSYTSVGGLVFSELGRLPRPGDAVVANGYSIRVETVRENRIVAVRISERRPATAP